MVPRGPELEGQERIQLLPMVATPCRVLGEEALDRVRPEQARAADHVGRAEVPEEGRQVGAEPACQRDRSEEHTSELQSHSDLVCRLLLEKKKKKGRKSNMRDYRKMKT